MSEPTNIKNPSAVALGKLSRGHKKTISQADRAARIERLKVAREIKARMSIPNPDYRTPNNGELVGFGIDDKGEYKLVIKNGQQVKQYNV